MRCAASPSDPSRRGFLRGRRGAPPWLPWSDPVTLVDACTRCGACIDACPEAVIARADGGFPGVDPRLGECTFCGACADACPEPVFDRSRAEPWPLRARIAETCLERAGVACRLCADACPAGALGFRPRLGGAEVRVDPRRCTGCGACVSRCPPAAIALTPTAPGEATLDA